MSSLATTIPRSDQCPERKRVWLIHLIVVICRSLVWFVMMLLNDDDCHQNNIFLFFLKKIESNHPDTFAEIRFQAVDPKSRGQLPPLSQVSYHPTCAHPMGLMCQVKYHLHQLLWDLTPYFNFIKGQTKCFLKKLSKQFSSEINQKINGWKLFKWLIVT